MRKELEKKLDQLETALFMNNMVDRWTQANFDRQRKLRAQILEVKRLLSELEEA